MTPYSDWPRCDSSLSPSCFRNGPRFRRFWRAYFKILRLLYLYNRCLLDLAAGLPHRRRVNLTARQRYDLARIGRRHAAVERGSCLLEGVKPGFF